jgi:hypothetical protein
LEQVKVWWAEHLVSLLSVGDRPVHRCVSDVT